jgi:glycosyltransferase involved in cell wall biosynthesis
VNVLFLTHAFPRATGDAAGSFILRLATALAAKGVTATVLAPHAAGLPEHETLHGIAVRRFRYAPERYETLAYTGTMAEQVRASWTARGALAGLLAAALYDVDRERRTLRPALLHAHWWFPSGLVAAAVSAWGRLPLVTTLHGSDVRLMSNARGARPIFARVARRSSRMTAVSSWLASQAHAFAPEAPAPIVAPMPVDVDLFTPGGARADDCLLFVGRLAAQKGPGLLLRALAALPAHVTLDVVGDGPDAATLRAQASALGVGERVRWHPAVPQPGLVPFYRAATTLVVPSVGEGLGLVAVEAHLCETPVVAFDSGGLPDVVADGETGVLAARVDETALAAAVQRVLERPDRGAALGKEGRARALRRFAPQAVAERYADIYQDAISHFHDGKG